MIENNESKNGGAICVFRTPEDYYLPNVDIENCSITENSAKWGGGFYCANCPNARNSVNIKECTISGNTATEDGGGVYVNLFSAIRIPAIIPLGTYSR